MKRQIVKLTWIARGLLGQKKLDAMLDEPVEFGYVKTAKYKTRTVPFVFPSRVTSEPLSESPLATDYSEEEIPELSGEGLKLQSKSELRDPPSIQADKDTEEKAAVEQIDEQLGKSTIIEAPVPIQKTFNQVPVSLYFRGFE